jgi:hypothetical protein
VRDRNAGERSRVTVRASVVGRLRERERTLAGDGDERVQRLVVALDASERLADELDARDLFRAERAGEFGERGYSMTFGTRYRPSSTAGATLW